MKKNILCATLIGLTAVQANAIDILTQRFDNNRTGANTSETTLTPANVNVTNFGKIFERAVDGQLYCQPLFVDNISVGGQTRNVVFLVTAKNVAYAFDATDPAASSPLWIRNFGNYIPEAELQNPNWKDIQPWIGTHGTPVIDRAAGTIYFVTKQKDATDVYNLRIRALNIQTGADKTGSGTVIAATSGSKTFTPKRQAQRPGLLLQGGRLYIGSASHTDEGDYQGWILAYNPSNLSLINAWCSQATGWAAGVWMSGGGLVGDGTNIFFTTGNGDWTANSGGANYGQSFINLNGTSLAVQSWFTPGSVNSLNSSDTDLGGSGVTLFPGTRLLVSGGKDGKLYLVNADTMGGFRNGRDNCLQSFDMGAGHQHGGPVTYNSPIGQLAYFWPENGKLRTYKLVNGTFNTTPVWSSAYQVPNGMPGGMVSISANGMANGIVWATTPLGNANWTPQPGLVHALDATTGTALWRSDEHPDDTLGLFAKNPPPVVNNGKLYVPTFSDKLVVYGPVSPRTPPGQEPGLISQNQPTAASSNEAGNGSANGNDGSLGTRWAANGAGVPAWWRVDLGSSQPITRCTINWYNTATRYYQYKIEVSNAINPPSAWTTVVDKTSNTAFGDPTDTFSATARYVRVTVTFVSGGGWPSLYEAKVYNN